MSDPVYIVVGGYKQDDTAEIHGVFSKPDAAVECAEHWMAGAGERFVKDGESLSWLSRHMFCAVEVHAVRDAFGRA